MDNHCVMLASVAIIAAIMIAAIPAAATASFATSCDVHLANVTTGTTPSSYLVYSCVSTRVLPFESETIAVYLRARPLDPSQSLIISLGGSTSGGCTGSESRRIFDTCGGREAKLSCSVGGYTVTQFNTYCVTVKPYSSSGQPLVNTALAVDIEYVPASEPAQWHLKNTGQFGGTPGIDVNAEGAWSQGAYGAGVVVLVVDQGVQMKHVEVSERFVPSLSWNPQTQSRDPTPPDAGDTHGTACAGVVAAAANNNYCGQGPANQASLAGVRIFGERYSTDTAGEVRALYMDEVSTDGRRVSVTSSSWGSGGCSSSGCALSPMSPPVIKSIQNGADTGRNGLGVVYVFSAGNDGHNGGDSNMRTYNKLAEVMCIAASDYNGKRIYYSNSGANLFVNSPSLGQLDPKAGLFPGIITSNFDLKSTTRCMGNFGGTSSATPLVAGILAQIVGARPDLTYRDVQHVVQQSATRNDPSHASWLKNGAGIFHSHIYGFGRINAGDAVTLAKKWTKVGPVSGTATPEIKVGTPIVDNAPSQPVISKFVFPSHEPDLPATVEHVMVYMNVAHRRPKDLRITLTSPYGTNAFLALPQTQGGGSVDLSGMYPLAARAFWGESPVGIWTISVSDEISGISGTFTSWAMEVTGNGTSSSAF